MRLTVLGACGGWPTAGAACSGFLLEHEGFRLVVDLGYGTMPRLLGLVDAEQVDAVLVSHGHPDHCADLNPLLRARVLGGRSAAPLPVHAPPGALDAVLALDRPGMLDGGLALHPLPAGEQRQLGPFTVRTALLPHWVPNLGLRMTAGGRTLTYTGDAGPSPLTAGLADGADLFLAESSYAREVPEDSRPYLSAAVDVGRTAAAAGAGRVLLTHLMPGTAADAAVAACREQYAGPVGAAAPGQVLDLG